MYLGLSILVVSISYICYKHPPTTWLFAQWWQASFFPQVLLRGKDAPKTITDNDGDESSTAEKKRQEEEKIPQIIQDDYTTIPTSKVEQDRKAMPPPPPPPRIPSINTPTSPTTPKASSTATPSNPIPSFNLSSSQSQSPLFPAANSSQRTYTTSTSSPSPTQPRLAAFPALNSAQRASGSTNAPQRLPAPSPMPPPSLARSSLPNRGPPSTQSQSASSLFPPPTHTSIPSKPSKKVLLPPNHSPLDWARLTSSPQTPPLNGLPPNSPYLRVPPSLLKQMTGRKGKDAWTVLGGKVYNITPYQHFHPGGVPELMKGAGRDGTRLFAEVHPWVNWEGMLESCLVGIAVDEGEYGNKEGSGALEEMD